MAAGKLDFGFAVDGMRNDLGICLEEAKRNGAAVAALVATFTPRCRRWAARGGNLEPDCPTQRQILRRVDPGWG
jgi:3-hydroxyisobutyrate dehydrogenase-like beta-hydroxyacid dehydrogenase